MEKKYKIKESFGVNCYSIKLLTLLRDIAISKGWEYNNDFANWDVKIAKIKNESKYADKPPYCLFFSNEWSEKNGKPMCAISKWPSSYDINKDWDRIMDSLELIDTNVYVSLDEIAQWKNTDVKNIVIVK